MTWSPEDEISLKTWFTTGSKDLRVLAFSFDGRYTEDAIRQELSKFNLLKEKTLVSPKKTVFSSSLELSKDMPSVEEALKILCAALKALETLGLTNAKSYGYAAYLWHQGLHRTLC